MKLNLEAGNNSEKLILEYLEANASEELANKINNGVEIEKDNIKLISKKTLSGFMKYANEEAKKTVKNGATYACIRDEEVFSWAIHYFEENAINGELFNLDGTKYETPKPVSKKTTNKPAIIAPKEPAIKQLTLFDLLDMESTPKLAKVIDEDVSPFDESSTSANEKEANVHGEITHEDIEPVEKEPNVHEDVSPVASEITHNIKDSTTDIEYSAIETNIADSSSNVGIEIVDDDGVITDISPAPSNVDDSLLSLFNM